MNLKNNFSESFVDTGFNIIIVVFIKIMSTK